MSLLFAPVVRARRLFSPRLEQVDPFIKGNLLAEARKLNRAGYSSAAVALARMAVERRMHELLIANCPLNPPRRHLGVGRACTTLIALNVVHRHESKPIEKFADRASKIVHGVPTTKMHARKLILEAAKVLRMLAKRR